MIGTENQYLESGIHWVESRIQDSWIPLVNITSCVEDAGFFRGKGKFSRTRARPREEKGLLFLFVCFPLHELHNKLTQLTSACHVLYEIEFYMNQTNFEFCQLLLFFYYSLKILIYSFFYLRTSEGHGCSCKGWLLTLQERRGGGVWRGFGGGWMASAKIVPFSKWLRGKTSSFLVGPCG